MDEQRTEVIILKLTPSEKENVKAASEKLQLTMSGYIRMLVLPVSEAKTIEDMESAIGQVGTDAIARFPITYSSGYKLVREAEVES